MRIKDLLEIIAQQIDKIAAKPLEAVFYIAGGFAVYQWLGWWGIPVFLGFVVFVAFMADVVVYFIARRQTYAKYGDTTLWMSGFHPLRARVIARNFDRVLKRHGEEAVIEGLRKHEGVKVTMKTPQS